MFQEGRQGLAWNNGSIIFSSTNYAAAGAVERERELHFWPIFLTRSLAGEGELLNSCNPKSQSIGKAVKLRDKKMLGLARELETSAFPS